MGETYIETGRQSMKQRNSDLETWSEKKKQNSSLKDGGMSWTE